MKNYVCRPKKDNKKCVILSAALLFLSAVAFFLSSYTAPFRAVGQMISIIFLLFFVQLSSKFLFTDYIYRLEEETLFLSLGQGKREKNLGYIPISQEVELFSKKEWETKKNDVFVSQCFSYCQNLFPANASYLLFPQEDRKVLLIFEPDEILRSLLGEKTKKKM